MRLFRIFTFVAVLSASTLPSVSFADTTEACRVPDTNWSQVSLGFPVRKERLKYTAKPRILVIPFRPSDAPDFSISPAEKANFIQSAKDINELSSGLSQVEFVFNQWQGAYGTAFINNDGAQAGSSISDLYNAFVFHFEVMKNYNLGLPMGKRAGQVNSEPSKVEGYYSSYSTALLKAKYSALRHLWFGYARLSLATSLSANGFKDYILSVENGPRLAQDTELQWNVIGTSLSTIDAQVPLHLFIIGQSPQLEQIFLEMTKHTRFIKSEMSSLLGISITYASGDGD